MAHLYFFGILFQGKNYFIEKENLKIIGNFSFEELSKMSPERASEFRKNAFKVSEITLSEEIKNAKEKLAVENKELLNFLQKCRSSGLTIADCIVYDESEFTEGTSLKIKVYNPTKKTIKYLWFSLIGYNPVGDKVIDYKKGSSKITLKGVGPIEPDALASYHYSYVWFTDLVEKAILSSIKIQYMDGTFKTISNPKLVTLNSIQKATLLNKNN